MDDIEYADQIAVEDNLSFKFVKVGSALRYGMTNELPEIIRNQGDGSAVHLCASLVYLCLHRFVDSKRIAVVPEIIWAESFGEDSLKKVIEKVSSIVIYELSKKIDFADFDELKDKLDQYFIPDWCFTHAEEFLQRYIKNMLLVNEELYFIGARETDTDSSLLRMNVHKLKKGAELIEHNKIERLACGFYEMIGYDDKLQRVYLQLYNQRGYYAYYDILNDRVVICRNRFHSFVAGNLFVITQDNYLAMVIGDTEHRINEYKPYEQYEGREQYFLVRPDDSGDRFFCPYYLYFNGKKVPAEKSECENILWEYMIEGLRGPLYKLFNWEVPNKKTPLPDRFSLGGIMEALNLILPKEKQCRDKEYILLKNIFGILESYLDKNADITKLLYALCEAGSLLNAQIGFPSEKLYWRLKEIEHENEDTDRSLAMLIRNCKYEILIHELVHDDLCSNKEFTALDEDGVSADAVEYGLLTNQRENHHINNKRKIGTFSFGHDGLKTRPLSFEEGIFLGAQIIPKISLNSEAGVVTYDAREEIHYITSEHDISSEDKLQLIKDFGIADDLLIIVKLDKTCVNR